MLAWLLHGLARSLLLAAAMFWTVFWAVVLGFTRSAVVRVLLSREQTERALGAQGFREVALATVWGAGSFSTSYAAVAMARTLFRKHGSLLSALVFLFASTNLSTEFLLVLWLLMGWRVLLLELGGGLVFIAVLGWIVRATWPAHWSPQVRQVQDKRQQESGEGCWLAAEGETLREKVTSRRNWALVADGFVLNWRRTWWQLLFGFVAAGCLAVFVPHRWWLLLQVGTSVPGARVLENALIGPLIALVCGITSPGNLPLARLMYAEGLHISGLLAFLYADLLAFPLLLMYRQHFGGKAAAYIAVVLWVSAFVAGTAVGLLCLALPLTPHVTPPPSLISQTSGGWRSPTLVNALAFGVAALLVGVRLHFGPARRGRKP